MTTIAEWLATRQPAPPRALERRLLGALGADTRLDSSEAGDACLAAGERLLATLLRDESKDRECALDLLAADALVTYAFEAASESPSDLAARAARAMTRIASLGVPAAHP